ncbi:MAG: 16S rRNA (cytosine(967)-C(5))-methyltransferase RsmB, partial [Nitrospiria bacterium]
MGAYQLLFLNRIPARAVVDEAVGLTQRKGAKGLSGFVNAVLRSLEREKAKISYPDPAHDLVQHLSIRYSHPEWMIRRWIQRYGPERTKAICQANNEVPPVTLRTNTLVTTRDELWAELRNRDVETEACTLSPLGLRTRARHPAVPVTGRGVGGTCLPAGRSEERLHRTGPHIGRTGAVMETVAYRKGWFYVQDEAAQLVVLALGPRPGEIILDACAAPGGKTIHIAQFMANQGRIIALDVQAKRLRLIRQNCERLGVTIVECLTGDARDLRKLTDQQFDRILVDAPCSGLGVLRRNPEGKWYKTEELIHRYARLQSEILEGVSPQLKEGGILLYSTCSTEPEENEQVVRGFLKAHPEFHIQDLRDNLAPSASPMITPE